MTTTRRVATVFGGAGFIGRYVVKRLAHLGYVVRVVGRNTDRARSLMTAGMVGQVVPLYSSLINEMSVRRAVEGSDIVVNLVGILAERRSGDFDRIQADAPGRIARACISFGVDRLVHVSAIGAERNSPSRYASSKAAGEFEVQSVFPTATILRPSVVFGPEDQFFNRFATMARFLPFMPVIAGETRFQPVYVGDVADAIVRALTEEAAPGVYELGGPQVMTMREVLTYILAVTKRDRRLVDMPMGLMAAQAAFLEHLPGKLLTRDQLLLLAKDNVVSEGMPGLTELGVVPTPVDVVVPTYLNRFRPGGGRREPVSAEASGSGLVS
jgi:NADH dehydrogenase